jgi:cytochrome P450 family 4
MKIGWFEKMAQDYGPVCNLTAHPFDTGFCIVADVKIAEALLSNQQEISKMTHYGLLQRWLGTGLLISSGKKWHQRRKILTPGFHFQILEKFAQIMNEQAKVFVSKLEASDGGSVDIFSMANLLALDIICGERNYNFYFVN